MLSEIERQVRSALVALAFFTVLLGLAYPAAITAAAHVLFPARSHGSLIIVDGRAAGSQLIGQPFSETRYFWGRPSATAPFPYNAAASAGSNLGPTNPALTRAVSDRIERLRAANPGNVVPIPVDLVTASGSGLDPHISPAAAEFQAGRVARARQMDEAVVRRLVARFSEDRELGVLGEPRVNVLRLNLALDAEGR